MAFPATLETLVTSVASETTLAGGHTAKHNALKALVEAIQAKMGIDSSAVVTSLDYLLKNAVTGTGGLVRLSGPALAGVPTAPTAAASNNSTQIATTAYADAAVAAAVTGLLDLKTATDCSGNPNYPAASKGDAYYVSVAGKIGGASGTDVDVGDLYYANADNAGGTEAGVGTSWSHLEHNLVGALVTSNALSELSGVASTARSNIGAAALASPTFTGVPAAPTAAALTNTTQIATTAFVTAAIAAFTPTYSNPLLGTDNESFGASAGAGLIAGGLRNSLFGKNAGTLLSTGDDNTLIGYGCGAAITTAVNCTAVGSSALAQHQTGTGQIAIGEECMNRMRGSQNIAIGNGALYGSSTAANNTGTDNVVIGYVAGSGGSGTNTTASNNCFIGSNAARIMSTINDAVAIGYNAFSQATSGGSGSVGIGRNALTAFTTTAVASVAIGFNTLANLTTGTNCVAVGYAAADVLSTAGDVIAIGRDAMGLASTGGEECVAIGSFALDAITTTASIKSVAIGFNALTELTTTTECVAVGHSAAKNMRGTSNIAIGSGAMLGSATPANNTGSNNVGVGISSCGLVTSGSDNCFVGSNSGSALTSAVGNTGMGHNVLASITSTATFATAYGNRALNALTSGINCVAVGYQALVAATTSGSNTACGFKAGFSTSTGGTGNLFLGANAGYAHTTGSNTCYIGDTTQGATNFAINTVVVDSSQAYGAIWTKPQTWSDRTYHASPNSAPTDGNIQAASFTAYLNEAGNLLTFRVKYTDGSTMKTGAVALV